MTIEDDDDPPPDLQEFLRKHGGLAEWDRAMADWQARRRLAYGPPVPPRGKS